MRPIDADGVIKAILRTATGKPWHRTWSDNDVENLIESQPTIDAVPVVRCKDCKYYEQEKDGYEFECGEDSWGVCENTGAGMRRNGFCSDGERKDDEQV